MMAPTSFLLAMLLAMSQSEFVLGHKCFVCTPSGSQRRRDEVTELQKSFPAATNFKRCNEYVRLKRDEFIFDCPPDSSGCLTKFHEGSVSRTCGKAAVDDCQLANGVTYCYCKKEACNSPDKKLSSFDERVLETTDDEDLAYFRGKEYLGSEGSGDADDDYEDVTDPPFNPFDDIDKHDFHDGEGTTGSSGNGMRGGSSAINTLMSLTLSAYLLVP